MVKETNDKARKEDEAESAAKNNNTHFCESVLDILLDFAGAVPLWSGVMLKHLGKTRDSNTIVENWFRTTKNVVLTSKLQRRAGDFLQLQEEFVVGRIKGMLLKKQVPQTKQPLSVNDDGEDIDGADSLPLSQEEKWKKRSTRKRKSKYFNSPPPTKKRLVAKFASASQKYPKTKSHVKGVPPPQPQKIQGCCP